MLSLLSVTCSYLLSPLPHTAPSTRAGAVFASITQEKTTEQVTPWQTTVGGIGFVDEEIGTGAIASPNDVVSIHYTVYYAASGQELGSSRGRWPPRPLMFALGKHDVPIFADAVKGMRVGGKRRLSVPASKIPESQLRNVPQDNFAEGLRFEMEFVGIESGVTAIVPSLLPPGTRRVTIARVLFALSFLPYLLPPDLQPGWYADGADPNTIAEARQLSQMMGGASLEQLGL